MEKTQAIENFIGNWNGDFPDYPLTATDLKKPLVLMGAFFQLFDRLGIDKDAVLAPPPEECRNEHTMYYWDLLPVISMTRIANHIVSMMPQFNVKINITHFLQPVATTSYSILLLLFNLMLFNEERLREIAPSEEDLFAQADKVKALEDEKNKLLELLNEQAEEKGKRGERLEKLEQDIQQLEVEFNAEKEQHEAEKQELESILKENQQLEVLVEQKKLQKESILTDIEHKRAQRVYDADEIRAKAEQAALNVQEAEEKLDSLRSTLMQKENSLKNLQSVKPNFDAANNLLNDIKKLSDSLKEDENGDFDTDSKEGEIYVLTTELSELETQLSELRAARAEAADRIRDAQAKRQQERMVTESALREAEEKDRKGREQSKKEAQRIIEINDLIVQYEAQKIQGLEELARIKESFASELKATDDFFLKKLKETEKQIEEKLRNRAL